MPPLALLVAVQPAIKPVVKLKPHPLSFMSSAHLTFTEVK